MSYLKDYSQVVFTGLSNTKVKILFSEKYGMVDFKDISFDNALDIIGSKIESLRKSEGKIYFFGNGASCSFAEHMAADFFKNAEVNTDTSSNASYMTAVVNDIGSEAVFSHKLMFAKKNDIVFAISSSGNSQNIINACNEAKRRGMFLITVSGKNSDNAISKLGDINFYTPLDKYGFVESTHPIILHIILDYYLDKYRGGRK